MLILNFSGFKSSNLLYEDLRSAQYRGDVFNFYNYIQRTLTALNQKCTQEGRLDELPRNIEVGLKTFKEKLPPHMRTILYALKPATIELALHELTAAGFLNEKNTDRPVEQKPQRQNFQNRQSNQNDRRNNRQQNWQPRVYVPHNNFNQHRYQNNYGQNNFHSRNYQNNQSQNFQNRNFQPRFQAPQAPRLEPMEVDASAQTRRAQANFTEQETKREIVTDFLSTASEQVQTYPIFD